MATKTTKGAAKPAKNTPASDASKPQAPESTPETSLSGSSSSDDVRDSNGDKLQQRTDLDVEYFRNMLLQERERLEAERDAIRASGLSTDGALPEEGEGGDEDTADLASAMMDKEMDLAVEEELEDLMSAIDHALQKIEDGSYGICDMSGEHIKKGRLELIPWAALTAENQAMSEGDS